MNPENSKIDYKPFAKKVWMITAIVSLAVISLLLFKKLFSVVLLVLAGILMAIYFHAVAALLKKWLHLPSKLAVLVSVLLNFILLAGFLWFVGARLQQQVSQLSETLPSTIDNAKQWLNQYPAAQNAIAYLNNSEGSDKTISVAKKFFSSSFGILSDCYIILLLGLFFTANPSIYKKSVIRLLPKTAKSQGKKLFEKLHKALKDWLKGQLFGFFFIAILTGIGLWIIGVPLILTLALIAGLMNFIPNFGPIIALIPALLLALMQGNATALAVVGLYLGIQLVQSAVTQPLIQKKMTSLPPALIVFGQVAMGLISGFWGVLLATPILAILTTVINQLYLTDSEE